MQWYVAETVCLTGVDLDSHFLDITPIARDYTYTTIKEFLWGELFWIFKGMSIDKPKVSKIFHFHLWNVRFNISSPPLRFTLSILRWFSSSKEILCAR